jgi:hypothetical protein
VEALGCRGFGGVGRLDSCRCCWLIVGFELDGCEHAKRRVTALAVVEDLDDSNIALASSTRVRHFLRLRSSTCIRAQNASTTALS